MVTGAGQGPIGNPYDLSTWRRSSSEQPPAQEGERRGAGRAISPHRAGQGAEQLSDPHRPPPVDPEDLDDAGAGTHGEHDPSAEDHGEESPDPLPLPRPNDPFELARRTVNRSRAAARDRGLFPISAKTQARDTRDRSGSAPGYSGARPDPRDPQGIATILKRVMGDLGWTEGLNAGRVLEEWDEIVGPSVAEHCRPISLDAGVLVVSASSSAWAAQLRMLTPQLISTIEEHVGAHVISELTVTGPAAAQRSWKKGRRTVTWRGVRDTYG